jgi:hypothetical protein
MEKLGGQPCGVVDLGSDEYQITPTVFSAFLDALSDALARTNHAVLIALAENTLAAALGVEARIQGVWRSKPEGSSLNRLPQGESNRPFGPVQVSSQDSLAGFQTGAERFQPILDRAKVLEQAFSGGEPAPRL